MQDGFFGDGKRGKPHLLRIAYGKKRATTRGSIHPNLARTRIVFFLVTLLLGNQSIPVRHAYVFGVSFMSKLETSSRSSSSCIAFPTGNA